ncbi:poly polymerase [Colletotrichum higginsianum]|nr:poly polymerase [Colletotrichum higginsianum]
MQEHRSHFARWQASENHWEMVRADQEAQGHDKESYEYSYTLSPIQSPAAAASQTKKKARPATYLLKLEGPFSDPETVKRAGGVSAAPPSRLIGIDDTGAAASFCKVGEATKKSLLTQLSRIGSSFQPTFYPVWYFFYETLADPAVLKSRLGVEPVYHPAKTRGGVLTTWGGKYRALVDGPAYGTGPWRAMPFLSPTRTRRMRSGATRQTTTKVVRCVIDMGEGEEVRGLTFRFIGDADA